MTSGGDVVEGEVGEIPPEGRGAAPCPGLPHLPASSRIRQGDESGPIGRWTDLEGTVVSSPRCVGGPDSHRRF